MKTVFAIILCACLPSTLFAQCGSCMGGNCGGSFAPMCNGSCGNGMCPMGGGGCCQGGQCQRPQYEDEQQQLPPVGSAGTPQFRPNPPGQFKPLPSPPPVETPALPPKPSIDWDAYDAQQKAIVEAQKKLTDQGEKSLVVLNDIKVAIGNQKGCQCQPTDLKPVLDAIADLKNTQPAPPVVTPAPQSDETHIVVVADHNAPYWQRLADALTNARKTYSGIQDTTLPPFPIGVTPQAVVYQNKVPVRVAKGQYEVENLLSRASRGESL